ncbi:MAG: polyprenol monophosphomannose synthase [Verrucomicrobium sp.]|nr:polyprenol monophosphomannose synthase [Verrucomicrobium sp.]
MGRALIVIPTYRELNNLRELLPHLAAYRDRFDILLVNDEAGDGTGDWVRTHPDYGQTLFLLERPGKQGLGTAYREGFRWALARDYASVFEMDADLSHAPDALPALLAALETCDVVVGSRYLEGVRILNWPISRLLLSLTAAQYARFLTGLPLTDPTSGFKGFRRRVLERIDLGRVHSTGYAFQIEMNFLAWWKGFRLAEVPIVFTDRHEGDSKMSGAIVREAVWEVFRLGLRRLFSKRATRP